MSSERVAADECEVGDLAGLNRAEFVAEPERLRRVHRRRLQRLERRHPGVDVRLELDVQAEPVRHDRARRCRR